ncbi:MAG: sugar phosphate isomerase/epimerase family protein [Terriglobia bacterium]|jgi:xylose isomerase
MIANHLFGACLPTFGNCADRFVLGGYGGGGNTMEEMLDLAKQVSDLDGVELVGNWHVNDQNIREVAGMLKSRGLQISLLAPDLWTQAKWGSGSLAAPDAKTRQAAVVEVKKVMDWAAERSCPYVDVWLGEDGFDYSFQADYPEAYKWIREGLAACAAHNSKVRVLVEYKPREPRTHCFVSTAAKILLLLQDMDNVGVLLDVGHALAAGENVAEAAALLSSHGKLDYLHLNDNYRSWDDDMMFGSVHLVESLELVYWLKRLNYKGWLTLDIFPYREDGVRAATQCREWIKALFRAVDRVGMEAFAEVIRRGDACGAMDLVRRAIVG